MKKLVALAVFLLSGLAVLTGLPLSGSAMEEMDKAMPMDHGSMPGMTEMGRGPAGLTGDSMHHAGKWMLTYKYKYMDMDGNRDGTDGVTIAEVLQEFMVAPEKMSMQMHMLGLMYGVNQKLTLMAMVPYTVLEMDHVTRMGAEFTTRADGVGDLKAMALYALPGRGKHRFHINAGLSFPTGSIDERDATPMGPDQKLPYPCSSVPAPGTSFPASPTSARGGDGCGEPRGWRWSGSARTTTTTPWATASTPRPG
jgi:hypothetical protein